jgi:predicted anti-sigma-YlaC factor YlaD
MSCERFSPLLSGYVDGELAADERRRLEEHLETCAACRRELEGLKALKEDLAMLKFKEPSDAELERYWAGVYNRLERGIGWILLSLGAILLLSYGALQFIEGLIRDPGVALVVKIGTCALVVGLVVLFVSLLRERLTVRKVDRYSKEVDR